jgi:hypothetical protein
MTILDRIHAWRGRRRVDARSAVISVLGSLPRRPWFSLELMKATGVSIGRLYPILLRLENEGLVASEWHAEPLRPGWPRRRRYYLTTAESTAREQE